MYSGVAKIFRLYWSAYGEFQALVRSPYLHAATALLVLTAHTWLYTEWWTTSIGALPTMLGFTVAAFAVFIGFGDEQYRALLAAPDEENPGAPSIYVSLCSTFVHFIVVQALALLAALLAQSWAFYLPCLDPIRPIVTVLNVIGGAIGFGLFLYAVTSVIAVTMHVLRIASMYEQFQRSK